MSSCGGGVGVGGGGGRGKKKIPLIQSELEVEELLRSAEDQILLQTRIDTHTTASSLDPDLDRRLHALKSTPLPPQQRPRSTATAGVVADEESLKILGGDLAARFAALKGPVRVSQPAGIENREEDSDEDEDGEGVSEREVEKVIQWAKDATRLDPAKSDDEDEDGEGVEDLQLDEEREEESTSKGKGKPRKWQDHFGFTANLKQRMMDSPSNNMIKLSTGGWFWIEGKMMAVYRNLYGM